MVEAWPSLKPLPTPKPEAEKAEVRKGQVREQDYNRKAFRELFPKK